MCYFKKRLLLNTYFKILQNLYKMRKVRKLVLDTTRLFRQESIYD
jgi:hypothetical protein